MLIVAAAVAAAVGYAVMKKHHKKTLLYGGRYGSSGSSGSCPSGSCPSAGATPTLFPPSASYDDEDYLPPCSYAAIAGRQTIGPLPATSVGDPRGPPALVASSRREMNNSVYQDAQFVHNTPVPFGAFCDGR